MIEEEDSIQQPYILIEGPRWGDAQFCAEWLLSAAKANEFWRKALNDPNFRGQIESLIAFWRDRSAFTV
jgi:hypothetical protein